MIASGDDNVNNQIRVTKNGDVYLSTVVGADNISNLRFRYETYAAGAGYVGAEAAADESYIRDLFNKLRNDWASGQTGMIN
jgi:hypothetical protein